MASYKKYVIMGVTTILIPIAKMIFTKFMGKYTEASEHDASNEANEAFAPARTPFEGRAE